MTMRYAVCLGMVLLLISCDTSGSRPGGAQGASVEIPRGYVPVLEIVRDGRLIKFGPFVGYYFRPSDPRNISRLNFVCLNERSFYTLDIPEAETLFNGTAVLVHLPDSGGAPPTAAERITPVFFEDAPASWLATRPEPAEEFIHFHSCYDASGAVRYGYWLRHSAVADFTYDMGGRVDHTSPLFHRAEKGVDLKFARIIEFDRGPASE